TARKLLFQAEQLRKLSLTPQAVARYEQVWPRWRELLLQYPEFRRTGSIQEDTYEAQLRYLRVLQTEQAARLRPLTVAVAQMALWQPVLDFRWQDKGGKAKEAADRLWTKIIPIRHVRGPFELLLVYDGPDAEALRRWALAWPYAPAEGLLTEEQQNRVLTLPRTSGPSPGPAWRPLIEDDIVNQVRTRLGLPPLPPPGARPQAGPPPTRPRPGERRPTPATKTDTK